MKTKLVGYTWKEGKKASPSLISAVEASGKHVKSSHSTIHKTWVLDYAFEKHGKYKAGRSSMKWRIRKKNTAHLYPSNTSYWEDTRKEKGYRHSGWFLFDRGTDAGLDRLISPDFEYARFKDPEGLLGECICGAAEAGHANMKYGFWEAQAFFCRSIHLMLNAEFEAKETYVIRNRNNVIRESDFVRKVDLFLRSRLTEKVALSQIARHCHTSVSALSHRYKKETGETPIHTLHRMRIDHAKALILRGFPLKAIGYDLGYSDEFHLSKTFKKITGISPREFKKQGGG